MSTPRVALYCRISRDKVGAGLGVERQERECRELAARNGWQVIEPPQVDNDLSAYSGKPRPGYRRLLEQVAAGVVDHVVVWHTDRLHRSPVELEGWIDACQPHGVQVHSVQAGPLDLATPSGRAVARTVGAWARFEVEHRSERVAAQKVQAAAAGEWRGGRRPFGYEPDGVTVRADEAAVVVEITGRVLAGESLHSLTRDLNTRGITTSTGRRWQPTELRKLITRARNAALIECDGVVQDGVTALWPAIVDPAVWRNARRLLTDPARRPPWSSDLRWLGSGRYRCGVCGDGTTMKSAHTRSRSRGAEMVPAYRCRNGNHLTRTANYLDDYVTRIVLERLSRDDARLLLAPGDTPAQIDLAALHARKDDVTATLDEIGRDAVRLGIPVTTVAAMTTAAVREIEELDAAIDAATATSPLAGFADADDVSGAWDAASVSRRKAIVDALMTVTLLPAPKGRPAGWKRGDPYFDPRAVHIEWRRA